MDTHDIKQMIAELLPQLKRHLEQSLSPQVQARFAVDDIVHDTYVRAIERLDSLEDRRRPALLAWLRRIAHRLLIDTIRRKQTQQVNGHEVSAIYEALTASGQLTPSRELSCQEAAQAVTQATQRLTDESRRILLLRYVDRMSFTQMADQLDQNPVEVRTLHRIALAELRRELGHVSLYFSD
jgi:RNA polymerase sigma-70 factor (ECF subfamily)